MLPKSELWAENVCTAANRIVAVVNISSNARHHSAHPVSITGFSRQPMSPTPFAGLSLSCAQASSCSSWAIGRAESPKPCAPKGTRSHEEGLQSAAPPGTLKMGNTTADQGSGEEGVHPLSEPPYRDRWVPGAGVRLADAQPGDPLFSSLYVLPTHQSFPSMIHDPSELTSSRAQPRRFAPSASMTTVVDRWTFWEFDIG